MNFPEGFLDSIRCCPGFSEKDFIQGQQLAPEVSVRANPYKPGIQFSNEEAVKWCSNAWYLKERPEFIFDPLLHAGCYYVQEASSMFLQHALRNTTDLSKKLKVLDLCAAPGGKSTLIAAELSSDSLLVSNEVIRQRAAILHENLVKWNAFNTLISNSDPEKFSALNGFFDLMITDVPCSGSGLFRKDAAAINEWSTDNVKLCAARQKRILADALPALKTNGLLFYSTCSFSVEENEEVLDWLCENYEMTSVRIPIKEEWGITESPSPDHGAYGYRFYPGKARGEGFFMGVLQKIKDESPVRFSNRNKIEKPGNAEISLLKNLLKPDERISFARIKNEIILYNKHLEQELMLLREKLNSISFGVKAGCVLKDELVPDHELAMSGLLNEHVDRIELSRENAIRYLRKDDLKITSGDKGWKLVTYQQQVLGWIKALGNRVNNYYPKEWRILKRPG